MTYCVYQGFLSDFVLLYCITYRNPFSITVYNILSLVVLADLTSNNPGCPRNCLVVKQAKPQPHSSIYITKTKLSALTLLKHVVNYLLALHITCCNLEFKTFCTFIYKLRFILISLSSLDMCRF